VDELAHTNAPGTTHTKRWQDVLRLLEAGIDVYTTLNVQHLESLNDVIAQITGVVVRETVPDSVFEQADEVELVDLYRQEQAVRGTWPARERLLVCVGPSPFAARLVRAARRMASSLKAPWVAVHVETPQAAHPSPADREQLSQTLRLVEQLGGETVTLSGHSIADEVLNYARGRNVTRIIVGKPKQPRWKELWRGLLVYELTRKCGDVDVYVISGDPQPGAAPAVPSRPMPASRLGYLWAVIVVIGCTGLSALLSPHLAPTNLVMVYLLGVVAVSLSLGRGPSILASLLSVAAFDFCLVPPRWTFAVADTQYLLTFLVMLLTGLVISTLTGRVQFQAESARRRERRTAALYAISRELTATQNHEQIARIALKHVGEASDVRAVVLLPDLDRKLVPTGAQPDGLVLSPHDEAVAKWVFEHGQTAGRGTATLPGAQGVYLPLTTSRGTVGVLGVVPSAAAQTVDLEQLHLLEAFAGLIALAIQRAQLEAEADQIRLDIETAKLKGSGA